MTLQEYARQWLAIEASRLAPNTLDNYRGDLERHVFPVLGARPLATIRRPDIRALLVRLRPKGASVPRHCLTTLSALFNAAIDDELIETNPCAGAGRRILTVPPSRPDKGLDERTTDAILLTLAWEISLQAAEAIFVCQRAGLRPGEALALADDDVDLERMRLRVDDTFSHGRLSGTTKTRRIRWVDLGDDLAALLTARLAQLRGPAYHGRRYLFAGPTGKPWTTHHLAVCVRRARMALGLPGYVTPHAFRHTFGTQLVEHGVDPTYVQRALGHTTLAQTDRYISGARQTDHAAINVLGRRKGPLRLVVSRDRRRDHG